MDRFKSFAVACKGGLILNADPLTLAIVPWKPPEDQLEVFQPLQENGTLEPAPLRVDTELQTTAWAGDSGGADESPLRHEFLVYRAVNEAMASAREQGLGRVGKALADDPYQDNPRGCLRIGACEGCG
jgi:hypothetical protein